MGAFIMLGVGIDDMIVFVQCYDNLSEKDKLASGPEKVALTMKHAGAAITVTSTTDLAAFACGAFSVSWPSVII
jgi:predicted RND superfamily exporter protein